MILHSSIGELREQYPARNANHNIHIGEFTYGTPEIKSWGENSRLTIGKFCSIAEKVSIFLGGEHRTDWVTTYPFNSFLSKYSHIRGHPKAKGDVVIGNDVWIATGATILSGVRIGEGTGLARKRLNGCWKSDGGTGPWKTSKRQSLCCFPPILRLF